MKNLPERQAMEPFRALMEAHAVVVGAIERGLERDAGLPLTWFEVLYRLAGTPEGSLRMQDLAERLVFSRSGVTRLVDRLETAGFVERASCPSDRRGTYAVLTEAGRAAFDRAQPQVRRAVEEHFGRHLDASEATTLTAALTKVIAASGGGGDSDCLTTTA